MIISSTPILNLLNLINTNILSSDGHSSNNTQSKIDDYENSYKTNTNCNGKSYVCYIRPTNMYCNVPIHVTTCCNIL